MKVDVAIDLALSGAEWGEVNRRVIKVVEPRINRRQGALLGD